MKNKSHMKLLHSCGKGGFFCPCCRPKKHHVKKYIRAVKRHERQETNKEIANELA